MTYFLLPARRVTTPRAEEHALERGLAGLRSEQAVAGIITRRALRSLIVFLIMLTVIYVAVKGFVEPPFRGRLDPGLT